MARNTKKGISLAKGPVAIVGLVLLIFGVSAFIMGGHSFSAHPLGGTVNGETWLGLEVNAWTSLLFVGAGAVLLFGSPLHWGAKSLSLTVGLVLLAAALIGLYDKQDVFGIFAANGLTKLVWAGAGALLIVLSLLPRVGAKTTDDDRSARRERVGEREPERFDRGRPAHPDRGSRRAEV